MLKVYRRRLILGLIVLLIVFALVFLISLVSLRNGHPLFGTGIGVAENGIVMLLSVLSMIKVIYEIIKVEHFR